MPFRPGDEGVTVRFTRNEALVLADLAGELIDLLEQRGPDATGDMLYA